MVSRFSTVHRRGHQAGGNMRHERLFLRRPGASLGYDQMRLLQGTGECKNIFYLVTAAEAVILR